MRNSLWLTCLILGACGSSDPAADVVFNEFQAMNDDWIELYNSGETAIDLSSYRVTDGGSTPRLGHAITFPVGTMIGAGEFLLIVANLEEAAMPGLQTTCLPEGPPSCFHASWGINRTEGESLYLLSPQDAPIHVEAYPPGAGGSGRAWGRLPDGTGAFVATFPTPAAANSAAP